MPEIVPETLKWTKSDPMNILKVQINTPWCLIEKNKSTNTKYIPVNIDNSKSHEMKTKDHQKLEQDLIADQQMLVIEPNAQEHVPVGMIAHSQLYNHSKSLKRKAKGDSSSEKVLLTKKRKTVLGSAIQTDNPVGMICWNWIM